MQMKEICIIIYKRILQRLHGRKNYKFYCKFQMGTYYILYNSLQQLLHRDFHSGNILVEIIKNESERYLIGDLGLTQLANNSSLDNQIYGVIPYIAPEILNSGDFSKESDIYSMGMIIWELTTGCKPFTNIEHDANFIYKIIDGKRPEITKDTPEDFANLMRKCLDSDPKKRPSAKEIHETVNLWLSMEDAEDHIKIFNQAEEMRLELIKLKMLGPNFNEKPHSKAIYTSKPLSFFISNSSMSSSNSMYNIIFILYINI